MIPTRIIVIGEFAKEQLAELVRLLWKMQKEINPKRKIEKMFLIEISNNAYTDAEIREIIKENFKDTDVEIVDPLEDIGDDIQKSLRKKQAM